MKTQTEHYPVTFLNGEEELKERGLKHLYSTKIDIEFFMYVGMNEDIEETRERLRNENLSFSKLREIMKQVDQLPAFYDYGLGFDFVEAGTFDEFEDGYYRYQLSWGGPSEEIRFHPDGTIEFVFLDWFVGIGFDITGDEWAEWLKEWFTDVALMDWENLDPQQVYSFEETE